MAQFALKAALPDAHEDGIWSVAWSSSGQIVTGACDEKVRTFTAYDGGKLERKHDFASHELGITSVTVSPDGTMAASSALDSKVCVWDLNSGTEVRSIDAGPIEAWTVAFSADSKLIASGSQGGVVNIWSVASGGCEFSMPTGGKFTMSVAWSPNGSYVACGAAEGAVYLLRRPRRSC